ncbi:hypothetical protein [Chenggangzhangella methanolivorans]|uniref:Uncharacterized protein n=1 Tax=Chenggangzhangella methanolivorans TaxID=1437009 RepID=A0A9E6REQ2_9HYPH|nr:hypothetical protein [Chenggangzhangella methanolivorans]QZN99556.1 hypothetical protein K6K41_23070 [Chenggangzhangella methanolivorans]
MTAFSARKLTDARRAEACARIDAAAEVARLAFITPGAGQMLVYEQKLREAEAFLADDTIAEDLIPHVVAEVGVTAETKHQVATVIVWMRDAWLQVSPMIERRRLEAKAAAMSAMTLAELEAAEAAPMI